MGAAPKGTTKAPSMVCMHYAGFTNHCFSCRLTTPLIQASRGVSRQHAQSRGSPNSRNEHSTTIHEGALRPDTWTSGNDISKLTCSNKVQHRNVYRRTITFVLSTSTSDRATLSGSACPMSTGTSWAKCARRTA